MTASNINLKIISIDEKLENILKEMQKQTNYIHQIGVILDNVSGLLSDIDNKT